MNYSDENKFIELIGKIPNVAVQGYNKKREVIYWNNASEIIYGYTKKEALGKNLEDLIKTLLEVLHFFSIFHKNLHCSILFYPYIAPDQIVQSAIKRLHRPAPNPESANHKYYLL